MNVLDGNGYPIDVAMVDDDDNFDDEVDLMKGAAALASRTSQVE
jgi:hypothetical protein